MGKQLIDYMIEDWNKFHAEMMAEMETLIRECEEALGIQPDTGERRREKDLTSPDSEVS